MLVSVIVPVFNGARFLPECLASITAQDYSPIEVIVVDDGSTDDSAEVAERFDGVRVVRREHQGLARTRNAGIVAARGEVIGWCDSDDLDKPGKLSRQVEYLRAHPDVAIVLCRQETMFEPGISRPPWLFADQVRGDLDGVQPASGLYRREVFERLDGFHTGMVAGSDFNLLVRARAAGLGIELLEDVLHVRRIHSDNMTGHLGPAEGDMFQTVREHLHSRLRRS